jgi:hypothetical protein
MCLNRLKKTTTIVPLAMMFLVIGILWPRIIQTTIHPATNWDDGLRGFVFGIAIGILLIAAIRLSRQRGCGEKQGLE